MMSEARCILHTGSDAVFWCHHRGHGLYRCPECNLVFVHPLPSNDDLKEHYDKNFFTGDSSRFGYMDYAAERPYMEHNYRHKRKRMSPHLGPGRRLLDVGCAYGFWLDFLSSSWTKVGTELSADAARYAREKLSLDVREGDLPDIDFTNDEPFDVVTMWDVIDHLRDPVSQLRKLSQIIRPGGLLVFNLGDISSVFARISGKFWYILIPPTHLFYFNRYNITELLEREGFRIKKIEREGKFFYISLCFYRLQYILPGRLTRWLYRKIDGTWLGNRRVYLNFGDILTIYAEKV